MNRLYPLRRFPMTLGSLALLAIPFGCGSDAPTTPVAGVPSQPSAVADAQPALAIPAEPTPMPAVSGTVSQAAQDLDQNLHQATGVVEGDLNGAKGLEREARLDADQAAGRIKGGVKKATRDAKSKVRDAKGEVQQAVEEAEAEAKRRAKDLEDDARKSAESALDNLLGNPK